MTFDEKTINALLNMVLKQTRKHSTNMKVSGEFKELIEEMQDELKEKHDIDLPLTKVSELLTMEIRLIRKNQMVNNKKKKWEFHLF